MSGEAIEVIKTQLEITDLAELCVPERPPERAFELERVRDPELNRWFYEHVGADHSWLDRQQWTDAQWVNWERRVETWMVVVEAQRAGYFELEPYARGRLIQLAYFGLLKPYQGLGIGGHVLASAIRRGLDLGPKVAVSTNTADGPHALANYMARGMRVVRRDRAVLPTRAA